MASCTNSIGLSIFLNCAIRMTDVRSSVCYSVNCYVKYSCIHYTVIVMFELQTYCDPAKRLELRFRQKDAGCRPLFGNRQTCKGLLLKVRRHHRQDISDNSVDTQQGTDNVCSMESASERSQSTSFSSNMYQYSADVIGVVDTVYRFQSKYFIVSINFK